MSTRATSTAHARIFGFSLAALWAACLVLNAASPSTRVCQLSDRDSATTDTHSLSGTRRVAPAPRDAPPEGPLATIRSKECATNEGRAEPGY
jgi:hypothetical protein